MCAGKKPKAAKKSKKGIAPKKIDQAEVLIPTNPVVEAVGKEDVRIVACFAVRIRNTEHVMNPHYRPLLRPLQTWPPPSCARPMLPTCCSWTTVLTMITPR